jgi:outer membrane protein, heavy metal efflux system
VRRPVRAIAAVASFVLAFSELGPQLAHAQTAPAAPASPTAGPVAGGFTAEQAVALALRRNRDVIAARLEIEAAQVERIAAGIYPNPIFLYSAGNMVLGQGNPQNQGLNPGPFTQLVHGIGISEVIDVWAKHSARIRAADLGVEQRRLLVEDALREVVFSVRQAFTDVVREQAQHELVRDITARYDETTRLARARVHAGEISDAEGQKIELEGLKYHNALIDSELELDLARLQLATHLAFGSVAELPGPAMGLDTNAPRVLPKLDPLLARALRDRPDLNAARKGQELAQASLSAAQREAYPDPSVGLVYTHSEFTVSGDNANSLGLSLSFPLPLFDRNQAGVARSEVELKQNANERVRVDLRVRHEVGEAIRRIERSAMLLDVYEEGGMLRRSDNALRVAESSYKAGSISLLELLEAQRTFIQTRMDYLQAQDDYRKAIAVVSHAVGEKLP